MFLPGSWIGILGGGQLGRMMAFAAKRMGYRVATLDPDPDAPCGQVADRQITAPYRDLEAVQRLGALCDIVTYEFENVSVEAVEALESKGKPVHSSSRALRMKQSRLREKESLKKAGLPVAEFQAVRSPEDLKAASGRIGFPAVLKTDSHGYDGKGHAVVGSMEEARKSFETLGGQCLIWEKKIAFVKELSVLCAKSAGGSLAVYPVVENTHRAGLLDTTLAPAQVPGSLSDQVVQVGRTVAEVFHLTGVFCVELFLLEDGSLLVNEVAPRPHNSGHYTIEACVTSQFEQHVRAICGLPLGLTSLRSAAVMVNILGDGRGNRLAGVEKILEEPSVYLHLYGKREAPPRRKMGHFTVLGGDPQGALLTARRLQGELRWEPEERKP